MSRRETLIEDAMLMREILQDSTELDEKIRVAQEEVDLIALAARNIVDENARTALSQEEYAIRYNALSERYEKEVENLKSLLREKELLTMKNKGMETFIETIKVQPEVLEEWNDLIFNFMIEKAVVHHDKTIEFYFFNGTRIRA